MTSPALTRSAAPAAPAADAADRRTGAAALLAATLSAAVGVTQVLYPQDTLAEIDPRTRVLLVAMSVVLWALAVVHLGLTGRARAAWSGRLAAAGVVGLTVGTLSSAANGEDLAFFPVVATVANAAWFIGAAAQAVSLWRAGRVPRPVAALLVIVMPCTIFLSQLGGGILAGAHLAAVGFLLLRGQLDSRRG